MQFKYGCSGVKIFFKKAFFYTFYFFCFCFPSTWLFPLIPYTKGNCSWSECGLLVIICLWSYWFYNLHHDLELLNDNFVYNFWNPVITYLYNTSPIDISIGIYLQYLSRLVLISCVVIKSLCLSFLIDWIVVRMKGINYAKTLEYYVAHGKYHRIILFTIIIIIWPYTSRLR